MIVLVDFKNKIIEVEGEGSKDDVKQKLETLVDKFDDYELLTTTPEPSMVLLPPLFTMDYIISSIVFSAPPSIKHGDDDVKPGPNKKIN